MIDGEGAVVGVLHTSEAACCCSKDTGDQNLEITIPFSVDSGNLASSPPSKDSCEIGSDLP